MPPCFSIPITSVPNWVELTADIHDADNVEAALGILKATYLRSPGPTGYNYENLTIGKILAKMVPRKNKNFHWIQGLRIFQRTVQASGNVDIVIFFFLRLASNNPHKFDTYCMSFGLVAPSAVQGQDLYNDAYAICRFVKSDSEVDRFDIIHAKQLPADFSGLASSNVLTAAFNLALGPANGSPPAPGKLRNPAEEIHLNSVAWHPDPANSNASMFSWAFNANP
jgi:hypothetical protein